MIPADPAQVAADLQALADRLENGTARRRTDTEPWLALRKGADTITQLCGLVAALQHHLEQR